MSWQCKLYKCCNLFHKKKGRLEFFALPFHVSLAVVIGKWNGERRAKFEGKVKLF